MPNHSYAHIIGHLGRDPEQRGQFASVSVAVTKSKKGGVKKTTWWRVSCYGKDAEAVMKLHKGDAATFHGEPELAEYAAKTGEVKQSLELNFAHVVFLGGKSDGKHSAPEFSEDAPGLPGAGGPLGDDDIPF